MAKIQLTLSSKIVNGKSEVLVRFYAGYYNERAKSGIFALRERWDSKGERLIIPRYKDETANECVKVNAKLDELKNRILDAFTESNGVLHKKWLQGIVNGSQAQEKQLVLLSDAIFHYAKNKVEYTTRKSYFTVAHKLQSYGDFVLDKVTNKDIEVYERKLRNELSPNTISTHIMRIRAVLRWAYKNGYTKQRTFEQIKVPTESYGTPIYLTLEERDKIATTEYGNEKLNKQRDVFVFHCHVGCRVSDLMKLTSDNVKGEFLEYIPLKTKNYKPVTVRVPLTETAKALIEKYKGGTKLLPFINSVEYNVVIKKLAKLAGIDRVVTILDHHTAEPINVPIYEVVTSHMARRTFMANLFKQTKSERIVISMTGHSEGSKSLSRYTLVDDDMKKSVIGSIDKKNGNQ